MFNVTQWNVASNGVKEMDRPDALKFRNETISIQKLRSRNVEHFRTKLKTQTKIFSIR